MNVKMKTMAEWFLSKLPAISIMTTALIGVILEGCGGMPILMGTPEIVEGSNYSFSISTSLAKEISGTWDRPYVIPKWALTCHRSIGYFWKTDIGANFGLLMYKELDIKTVYPLYPGEIENVKSLKCRYVPLCEAVFKRNLFTGSSNSCAILITLPVFITLETKVHFVGSHRVGTSKVLYFSSFFHYSGDSIMYKSFDELGRPPRNTPGVGIILGSAFKASFAYIHVELGLGAYFEEYYQKDYYPSDTKAFLHPFINVGVRQR